MIGDKKDGKKRKRYRKIMRFSNSIPIKIQIRLSLANSSTSSYTKKLSKSLVCVMTNLTPQEKITLFKNLFKSREDVFAVRWESYDRLKSGYTPVFTDSTKTAYRSISENDIRNHLLGNNVLGVYPLLIDNTSHFIVADFDEKNWKKDVLSFRDICEKKNISVGIEISRSGNGAHVWCSFESAYPACKSRKIFLTLLREAKCIDEYAPNESFDRLFPNQDMHSGKGLGNLIALPLQGKSRKENRTVFVDPSSWLPWEDQWEFLAQIKRMTLKDLDSLYEKLFPNNGVFLERNESGDDACSSFVPSDKTLQIEISDKIRLPRNQVSPILVTHLRENLNFLNSEYFAKSKIGFSTHAIEKFFKTVSTDDFFVLIPRGYLDRLLVFLKEKGIDFALIDKRKTTEPINPKKVLSLYPYQQEAMLSFTEKESGILVAPPGSGKTIMGLALALSKGQPTLIITHRQNIFDQWMESIENFLGIPKKEIGRYGSVVKKLKTPFTVAMMQTLARTKDLRTIFDSFGCVIVDECHHVPAKMFRSVVSEISSKYLFGLTATPKRKYNDQKLIYAYLGDIVHTVSGTYEKDFEENGRESMRVKEKIIKNDGENENKERKGITQKRVHILKSNFEIPYTVKISDFFHLKKLLSFDVERNSLIAEKIQEEVSEKRKVLVLCERKEHIDSLWYFLKGSVDVLIFTGTLSAKQKRYRTTRMKNGTFQVILATGQFLGEGSDIAKFDSLFLVSPHSFEGKLIQYIGRLRKNGNEQRIFDVRDSHVPILEKSFQKRMIVYRKMVKSGEVTGIFESDTTASIFEDTHGYEKKC